MIRIIDYGHMKVSDLTEGFMEDTLTGQVSSMNGRLNIRPAYQREFVWDKGSESGGKKQIALIDSILHGYPINVMYFVKIGVNQNGEDMYEVLDGQQRIITMCHFKENMFGLSDGTQYDGLTDNTKFNDFDTFTVYVCEADSLDEKLEWFERINTAGESLKEQEMRSAIACGNGTTLAKKYFVNTKENNGTNAYSFDIQSGRPARDYISKEWERQGVYEQVVKWFVDSKRPVDEQGKAVSNDEILAFMKNSREDTAKATEMFEYFKNVIRWIKRLFPTYNADMKKVEWGFLYNKYHNNMTMTSQILERQVNYLRQDVGNGDNDHLKNANGIYEYVLAVANGENTKTAIKYLQPRTFSDKDKKSQYERQRHVCPHCKKRFEDISWMVGDHIVPYSPIPTAGQENGKTTPDNLQMLCNSCNLDKSNHPFNRQAEEQRLQELYAMTDDEVAALPDGTKD